MDKHLLTDPDGGAALGESRAKVLDVLRLAGTPLGVQEVARRLGLHPNTARFHLDGLAEGGLVERGAEERDRPGRPRIVYRAAPAEDGVAASRRSYRLLAEMLTSMVAGMLPEPAGAAAEAGRAWGRYLTQRPAPFQRIGARAALDRLVELLTEIGFSPEAVGGETPESEPRILLRHCPFREIAEKHRDVVCGLHLGLMQGALGEMDAPVRADRLEPFVEPNLCRAHLSLTGSTTRESANGSGEDGTRKGAGTGRKGEDDAEGVQGTAPPGV